MMLWFAPESSIPGGVFYSSCIFSGGFTLVKQVYFPQAFAAISKFTLTNNGIRAKKIKGWSTSRQEGVLYLEVGLLQSDLWQEQSMLSVHISDFYWALTQHGEKPRFTKWGVFWKKMWRDKQKRGVREKLMKLFRGHQETKNAVIKIPLEKWWTCSHAIVKNPVYSGTVPAIQPFPAWIQLGYKTLSRGNLSLHLDFGIMGFGKQTAKFWSRFVS